MKNVFIARSISYLSDYNELSLAVTTMVLH